MNFIHFFIEALEKKLSTDPGEGDFFSTLFLADLAGLSFSLHCCCFDCILEGDGEDLVDSAGIFESGVGTSTGSEDEDEGEEDSSMAPVMVSE